MLLFCVPIKASARQKRSTPSTATKTATVVAILVRSAPGSPSDKPTATICREVEKTETEITIRFTSVPKPTTTYRLTRPVSSEAVPVERATKTLTAEADFKPTSNSATARPHGKTETPSPPFSIQRWCVSTATERRHTAYGSHLANDPKVRW